MVQRERFANKYAQPLSIVSLWCDRQETLVGILLSPGQEICQGKNEEDFGQEAKRDCSESSNISLGKTG
jgi:hypothetical protein